jgi:outer membrane receptor protein involved in Fe transport
MKFKMMSVLCAFLLLYSSVALSQSKETGAIIGTVSDEEGAPLPGVNITISGPNIMGDRTIVTDANGRFRVPALPPGVYSAKAELPGFNTVIRKEIRLHSTTRLTADFTMAIATLEEEVTVIAESPTVDVKSSETASVTLSGDLLRAMPTAQFAVDIVNMAPGVSGDVAYGASDGTGISYQVDGVDVSDPELGSAWVFLDYNIIEEAKVMGIGLNAEYGAFTGVIFNSITKSGGNEFSGHAEIIGQSTNKKFLGMDNFFATDNNQAYIEDNPGLTSPIQGLWDSSFHLGGPIKKDKVWFFLGLQYYRSLNRPTGLVEPNFRDYKQPRFFLKLTSQMSSKIKLSGFYEYDEYMGINRSTGTTSPTPETGVSQDSLEHVGNLNMTFILSPSTFIDVKTFYFWGYYYLLPQGTGTAVWDAEQYIWLNNNQWVAWYDRKRAQSSVTLSHYVEDFIEGSHDFKFGADFEWGWARSKSEHTGYVEGIGAHTYISDYYVSYGYLYAYQYDGYDYNSTYTRAELFAQDSWSITNNLTLNFGLRYSMMRGYVKYVDGSVYSANRIAPRFGLAWDIFGDHKTVLKGHWGRFTEGMFTGVFDRLNPVSAFNDWVVYYGDNDADETGDWTEWYRVVPEETFLADNIKHPYMDQWTVGVERELFKDASFGISYINRRWKSILGTYDLLGQYEEITENDPTTGAPYTVYNQLNPGERQLVLANIVKDPSKFIMDDVYRQYHGVEVLFNKRFSNRWQLLASYVWSKCTGTIDNGFGDDVGWGGDTYDPNWWINRDGSTYNDPTHMLKLQGSYIFPFEIHFNAYFRFLTGNTYNRGVRFGLDQGRTTILSEAHGSRRLENRTNLDLRLEKTFTFKERFRIGFMIDIFNVFNDDSVTDWGTTINSSWYENDPTEYPASDGHRIYSLVNPRAIRLGIRLFF